MISLPFYHAVLQTQNYHAFLRTNVMAFLHYHDIHKADHHQPFCENLLYWYPSLLWFLYRNPCNLMLAKGELQFQRTVFLQPKSSISYQMKGKHHFHNRTSWHKDVKCWFQLLGLGNCPMHSCYICVEGKKILLFVLSVVIHQYLKSDCWT